MTSIKKFRAVAAIKNNEGKYLFQKKMIIIGFYLVGKKKMGRIMKWLVKGNYLKS